MEKETEASLVVRFDNLVAHSQVLQTSCEDEFLRFVLNTGLNRRRWEHAELECQRLSIELSKASQEVSNLEHKLSHARGLLDNELSLRKKAENERDRLANQLSLLRQLVMDDHLVDEVKLSKLKSMGDYDLTAARDKSPSRDTPKGILKKINRTEESVHDVEDFSFDETRELCESRSRLDRSGRRKRSRSVNLNENILEQVASPKQDKFDQRKRTRRSRSIVAFPGIPDSLSAEDTEIRPRSYSAVENQGRSVTKPLPESPVPSAHNFVQKTFVKSEKCCVCNKRIKFGKIAMKCTVCRIVNHPECSSRVPLLCSSSGSPEVLHTPRIDGNRSPVVRKQYFASPMLK